MADPKPRTNLGFFALRGEDGALLAPENIAAIVQNMEPTADGTLRSVQGPAPYHWDTDLGAGVPWEMSTLHGLFHCMINNGERDILLCQEGGSIKEFVGWDRSWRDLFGIYGGLYQHVVDLPDDSIPRAPVQFCAMPNGVVIMPQAGRAFFYDGDRVLPLGFARAPGAPHGKGPTSKAALDQLDPTSNDPLINADGFAHDGQWYTTTGVNPDFGSGRVGTVERWSGTLGADISDGIDEAMSAVGSTGILMEGRLQGAYQWIDCWGNLSPLSGRSGYIKFDQQRSRWFDDSFGDSWKPAKVDLVLKFVGWSGIENGPDGTIGKIFCRTRDVLHAGTAKLFEVPPNAADGSFAYATIPDNCSTVYPDNTPDSWLIREPIDAIAVQEFHLGEFWDGRFWATGFAEEPSKLHPSLPGRWGTFVRNEDIPVDCVAVTAIRRTPMGLLVFGESSTFMVTRADAQGNSYRTQSLSGTIGCIASDSVRTLPNGITLWLSRDGFYGIGPDAPTPIKIGGQEDYLLTGLNVGRAVQATSCVIPDTGEYRCWICVDAARRNNICVTFDTGGSWRRRTDLGACAATCVTQDHRGYVLCAGTSEDTIGAIVESVWIQDVEVFAYAPAVRESFIQTAWIGANRLESRHSPLTVNLVLRESTLDINEVTHTLVSHGTLTVQAYRDWDEGEAVETVIGSHLGEAGDNSIKLYPSENPPAFWSAAAYDDGSVYKRRRPFVRRVHLGLSSCEVFKLQIGNFGHWEFLGLSIDEQTKERGGQRTSP